ncbi:MAG: GNAT family N-acetyltransferase [Phycisphaerales bacterium JB060]
MDASGFSPSHQYDPRPLPASLSLAAAERLIDATGAFARQAAQRLIAAGPEAGISFEHAYATIHPETHAVRELALAVPSPGRSALAFLSRPQAGQERAAERAACAVALTEHLAGLPGRPIDIAQSLPSVNEPWAAQALSAAGWSIIGELAYMRRGIVPQDLPRTARLLHRRPHLDLPDGVELDPIAIPDSRSANLDELVEALDDSYIDTLDCPALCGMRRTSDIVASHAAIGRPELAIWQIVRHEGRPAGAVLLACLPEQRCYELVYIGLGPSLRGIGLGERLLRNAIDQIAARIRRATRPGKWSLTCAVDIENQPAVELYRRLDFMSFDRRIACVHGLDGALSTGDHGV